ncbi:MAG TPA: hypothetical protein VK007_04465 [Acidimicrobiales bacterium]|nr:hypothetical protein [Acidimicrobiales bacterium]
MSETGEPQAAPTSAPPDLSAAVRIEQELDAVERALEQIDQGVYDGFEGLDGVGEAEPSPAPAPASPAPPVPAPPADADGPDAGGPTPGPSPSRPSAAPAADEAEPPSRAAG